MALNDLSLVTDAIGNMIKARIQPTLAATVNPSPQSPQAFSTGTTGSNIVSVYLFHLIEDGHHKNLPPRRGSGPVPIQHTSLGLNLHYVITAHHPVQTDLDARVRREQWILGLAAKAVHDEPVLSAAEEGFQIILRPVSIEDAVNFWSGDDTQLSRPSLFVEARVVLLEPEPPQALAGIVYSVGSFVIAGAGPQLTTSRSTITFVPPGLEFQEVQAEPARVAMFHDTDVPYDDTPPTPAPPTEILERLERNNLLTLVGAEFGSQRRFLELQRVGMAAPVRLGIDVPGSNGIWVPQIGPGEITLRVWTSIFDELEQQTTPLVPGIYTARVIIDLAPRPRTSNQLAFAAIPQVKEVTHLTGNQYTLEVMGLYLNSPDVTIQLTAGKEVLLLRVDATLSAGEFEVQAPDMLRFERTPEGGEVIDVGHPLSVTLIINGATATPAWITET
jgi:hypothetical protein